MELKIIPTIPLEHYTDFEDAEEDCSVLEDAGFHPTIREESREFEADAPLFLLEAPESEFEAAYDTLMDFWETERSFSL